MKKIIRLATAGLILFNLSFIPAAVNASERIKVCAEYENTGKSYFVDATHLTGRELNQATNSSKYRSFSEYVVIFWDQGKASVIELNIAFGVTQVFGKFFAHGQDQRGYPWILREVSLRGYC